MSAISTGCHSIYLSTCSCIYDFTFKKKSKIFFILVKHFLRLSSNCTEGRENKGHCKLTCLFSIKIKTFRDDISVTHIFCICIYSNINVLNGTFRDDVSVTHFLVFVFIQILVS